MDLRRLASIAARQHGLITLDQYTATGQSPRAWYRAVERGDLEPLHPGVARLVGQIVTREQRVLAGVLAVRRARTPPEQVLASHRSAAYLLGLDRPADDPVDVTVVGADHRRRLSGVVVHRSSVLADLTPTTRRGISCTNELRTLVDLGAVDPAAVAAALDRFAVTRRITPSAVEALIERHARPGRTGVTALRAALADWPIDDGIPDSELELAMARLLRDHGLPKATFHPRIAGYEVDFAIDGSPVVVECDGWTYHGADRDQWQYDKDRDSDLHAAGRVVLRRSRDQIVREPTATANHIRALLRQWSPHLL